MQKIFINGSQLNLLNYLISCMHHLIAQETKRKRLIHIMQFIFNYLYYIKLWICIVCFFLFWKNFILNIIFIHNFYICNLKIISSHISIYLFTIYLDLFVEKIIYNCRIDFFKLSNIFFFVHFQKLTYYCFLTLY